MPNYISKIDFGDGVQRKVRVQSSGGGITDFVDIPTVEETEFAYDGTEKELVFTGLDTDKVTVSGTTYASAIGDYTCTLTLASEQYCWKDLTTDPIIISWSIASSVYGAEWDGTSTTSWTRTDGAENFTDPNPYYVGMTSTPSSPFDNISPWKDMKIVEDADAGTLVSIPKYYFKWTKDGTKMKLQISTVPAEGFLTSPAHADRGDNYGERDVVYVGAYHCANGTYKSTSGVKPAYSERRSSYRSYLRSLGGGTRGIWQYDYAMFWTIAMLYLVEFANWDSQAMIGYGCSSATSVIDNTGLCDSLPYHTGTNTQNRETYGHVRYRYIEDLWSNVFDWCDGIYFAGTNKTDMYCIKDPRYFADSSTGAATYVGSKTTNGAGAPSVWGIPTASGFEYALYPIYTNGGETTYVSDRYTVSTKNGVTLAIGGSCDYLSRRAGLFQMDAARAATYTGYIGARLMMLPK